MTTRSMRHRTPYDAVLLNDDFQWLLLMHQAMTPRAALNLLVAVRCKKLTQLQLAEMGIAYYGIEFTSQQELGWACNYKDNTLLTDVFCELMTRGLDAIEKYRSFVQPVHDMGFLSYVDTELAWNNYEDLLNDTESVMQECIRMENTVRVLYADLPPSMRFFIHRYAQRATSVLVQIVQTISSNVGSNDTDLASHEPFLEAHPEMLAWADLLTAQPLRAKGHPARLPCTISELLSAPRRKLKQVMALLDDTDYR